MDKYCKLVLLSPPQQSQPFRVFSASDPPGASDSAPYVPARQADPRASRGSCGFFLAPYREMPTRADGLLHQCIAACASIQALQLRQNS